jgi:hypothetical protein
VPFEVIYHRRCQHTPSNKDQNRTKFYFLRELLTTEKSQKRRDKNEKQLLVTLMNMIVLATVFVAGCTGGVAIPQVRRQ